MSTQPTALSFDPSTFVEGGGIINDVDVTWGNIRVAYTKKEYDDKVDGQQHCAVHADLGYTNRDGKQDTASQFWVIGKATDYIPNDTGTAAISLHGKALHSGTNVALLIKSLIDNGCPVERVNAFASDVRTLSGLFCHMQRRPETRDFADKTKGNKRSEGPLVVTKIHRFPWDVQQAQAGTAAFKPNGTAAAAPAGGGGGAAQDRAMTLVGNVMTAKPGVTRQVFNIELFKTAVSDPEARGIAQSRAFQDSLGLTFPGE